ncbi:FAD-dependent oxidoreductase [Ruficoccus amylovorans]|uniref:FAD-dependent oxidoreductase n=2 Tax=Ruficoccus amylovorans TaxID=1804625 RepID=A0A842H9K8_9BACT|nr:FAD-dependent oxidoreductase [Ruficoccus amylovorans]
MKDRGADVAIVGAGITGLMAARALARTGTEVVVLEKSPVVGGRVTTRRFGDAVFDLGVQNFTARSDRFRACVEDWVATGICVPWYTREGSSGETVYYRGVPTMGEMVSHLAEGLDLHCGALVTAAVREEKDWFLQVEGDAEVRARTLVLTAPAVQSRAILDAGGYPCPPGISQALHRVGYVRTLTVLAQLDGPSGLPAPGILEPAGAEPVAWVADNQLKGISPVPCLTIHSGPEFAQRFFDEPEERWSGHLLNAVRPYLRADVVQVHAHRWRYAFREEGIGGQYLADSQARLWFAGDAFIDKRVEGAALSGLAAADSILSALGAR